MPFGILSSVLTLAERLRARFSENGGTALLRYLVVSVNVVNRYMHVLRNLVPTWRTILRALPSKHDRAITNNQLCMQDGAAVFHTETLNESEDAT